MEIWKEIERDCESGARRLVDEYGNRLFAAASFLCADAQEAEALVFRTLDRAVRKIRQYDGQHPFYSWLYAIMLNFRRMDLRRRRPDLIAMGTAADLPEVPSDAFGDVLRQSGSDEVAAAVRALSEPLRETVVLRYFNDLPVAEIAAILKISPGTVKSRLHNARAALYASLAAKGKEEST